MKQICDYSLGGVSGCDRRAAVALCIADILFFKQKSVDLTSRARVGRAQSVCAKICMKIN